MASQFDPNFSLAMVALYLDCSPIFALDADRVGDLWRLAFCVPEACVVGRFSRRSVAP